MSDLIFPEEPKDGDRYLHWVFRGDPFKDGRWELALPAATSSPSAPSAIHRDRDDLPS